MAGHSKWANIKHRKSANDLKRAKYFSKLIREITAAVKQAGSMPEANPRLRLAIQNAKGANMPKENIERAIHKGAGGDATTYTTIMYEGHGAFGIALIVACMTDNLNRTVASVRAAFNKYGGSLGKQGSVTFLFDRKGIFSLETATIANIEALTLSLIDSGAEDIETEEAYLHIVCSLENFGNLQKKFEELAIEPCAANLVYVPNTQIDLGDQELVQVKKLIEALEDQDDVQKVYHNCLALS